MAHPSQVKVLIVEDDGLLSLLLEDMVASMGYSVVGPMHNLQDGLDHAAPGKIDFALLDFDLGEGTDALPIAEKLGRLGIPFVFTSGTDPRIIRASIPNARVITKPIAEEALELVLP